MFCLSVVVPCHNERDVLPELYRQVMAAAAPLADEVELVLVDDGSTDGTGAVATELAAGDPRVRVIELSRNFGKEGAISAGFDAARGDAVVLMDADLQHPPELLAELVRHYHEGADQVIARRDRHGDPRLRSGLSRLYYHLVNRLVDVRLEDGVGDYRLLSRRAVDAVRSLGEVNRFSKGLFSWIGFRSVAVDYQNVPRARGRSSWSFATLFNYGIDGVISFNNKPLRASIWCGLVGVALSTAYVAWLLYEYVLHGIESPGYLTTIAAIVFLGGVQLIFLGIIGEYVGRIYYETKRRPTYIVASDTSVRRDPREPHVGGAAHAVGPGATGDIPAGPPTRGGAPTVESPTTANDPAPDASRVAEPSASRPCTCGRVKPTARTAP